MYNKVEIYLRDTTHNRPQALRPKWFNYERCFINLLKTTNWNHAKLTVVLDGKYEESHISKYIPKDQVVEINTSPELNPNRDGSNISQTKTVEIAGGNIANNSIIYLLENDYLHRPGWNEVALDCFNVLKEKYKDDNYYLSLYDHADKYILIDPNSNEEAGMYKNLQSKLFLSNFCHWRSVPNTTSSYLMTPENFSLDYDLFVEGGPDNGTCEKLSWRGRKFATPIPAWSTHVQHPWMAVGFDWEAIQNA